VIVWADVVNIAPGDAKIAAVPLASQTAILADVYAQMSAANWGTRLDLGAKWFAAHLATVGAQGALGAGGPVSEHRVGEVARSYAVPTAMNVLLETTPYGKEFVRLYRSLNLRWLIGSV